MSTVRTPAQHQTLYELHYLCGHESGIRRVWAPDERTAISTLRKYASLFGLQHETVLVTRVVAVEVREARRDAEGIAP